MNSYKVPTWTWTTLAIACLVLAVIHFGVPEALAQNPFGSGKQDFENAAQGAEELLITASRWFWRLLLALGAFCLVCPWRWVDSLKPTVLKAIAVVVVMWFLGSYLQNSVGKAIKSVNDCPLSVVWMSCSGAE